MNLGFSWDDYYFRKLFIFWNVLNFFWFNNWLLRKIAVTIPSAFLNIRINILESWWLNWFGWQNRYTFLWFLLVLFFLLFLILNFASFVSFFVIMSLFHPLKLFYLILQKMFIKLTGFFNIFINCCIKFRLSLGQLLRCKELGFH